jgi:TonB family protein
MSGSECSRLFLTLALTAAKRHSLTLAASVIFHAVVSATVSWDGCRTVAPEPREIGAAVSNADPSAPIGVELPSVSEGFADERTIDPAGDPPRAVAGAPIAHPDTGAPGRGGDTSAPMPATNLAAADERILLSPDLLNRLDRDQVQRLRVASVRVSWEDRRSTSHPAELTLVVIGPGTVRERRSLAATEPNRGVLDSPAASVRGSSLGATSPGDVGPGERRAGEEHSGTAARAPGQGLRDAPAGTDHRVSAPIGSARPAVALGPVAVLANARGLPKDNVESEQEVAATIRSLVHASTAGGLDGDGAGGGGGGGEPGVGSIGPAGFRSRPMGVGDGDVYDYWTSDPRLVQYFRRIHARIDPLWKDAFPKHALLELRQGTVILEFTVFADGRAEVSWPPVRPSGVNEFDANCADAVRRASPFPPIPAALGVANLRIRAPFVASNPIVK